MVHQIYKATVANTNKQVPQRDITAHESLMQGLRFSMEKLLSNNSDFEDLSNMGFLDGVYLEDSSQGHPDKDHILCTNGKFQLTCGNDFQAVKVHGQEWWSLEHILTIPSLPGSLLSNAQSSELTKHIVTKE